MTRMRARSAGRAPMVPATIALLALAVAPRVARAADGPVGFAIDRFEPSERGSDWFVHESLDLRGKLRPAIGVLGEWSYKPLVSYAANGDERAAIIKHQVVAHLGASVVVGDRFRFGVNVPLVAYQTGARDVVAGRAYEIADKTTVGDARLTVDARLAGTYGDPITVAIGVRAYAGTGHRDSFTGDENARFTPRLMFAGDIGPIAYALQGGLAYRGLNEAFAGTTRGTEFTFGGAVGVRAIDRKLLVGPELFGSTVIESSDSAFKRRSTPVEVLLGLHYTAGDFRIGAGAGPGISRGYGSPAVRVVGLIEWAPGYEPPPPPDRDHDGIPDVEDACPDVPGVRTDDPKTNGCPAAPSDRDHDGVPDAEDACPDVPGIKTNDPKTNGCPPPNDRDKDGIPDAEDACPDVPGVRTDDPKTNGCPPDRDKDGVPDAVDACPDVPGVRTEDPKTNGCPPDRDGDGIPDTEDACPDQPGPRNADPKKNGCPDVKIEAGQLKILEQVQFKTASDEILPESDRILQAVAKALTDHPEITKVRVEGHTDNRGAPAFNKALSQRRAASVVKWLVAHGIDKGRLTSAGFGPDRPIDSNATDEGRQKNRRVEFHIEPAASGPGKKK